MPAKFELALFRSDVLLTGTIDEWDAPPLVPAVVDWGIGRFLLREA